MLSVDYNYKVCSWEFCFFFLVFSAVVDITAHFNNPLFPLLIPNKPVAIAAAENVLNESSFFVMKGNIADKYVYVRMHMVKIWVEVWFCCCLFKWSSTFISSLCNSLLHSLLPSCPSIFPPCYLHLFVLKLPISLFLPFRLPLSLIWLTSHIRLCICHYFLFLLNINIPFIYLFLSFLLSFFSSLWQTWEQRLKALLSFIWRLMKGSRL